MRLFMESHLPYFDIADGEPYFDIADGDFF